MEYLCEKKTLSQLVVELNDRFGKKKTGKKFKVEDVQQYVKRGKIPEYLGGNEIVKDKDFPGLKVYNLLDN